MSYHPGMGKDLVDDLYTDPPGFRACTGLFATNLRATCLAADALYAQLHAYMLAARMEKTRLEEKLKASEKEKDEWMQIALKGHLLETLERFGVDLSSEQKT
jgi:hypothetical protein